MLDVAARWQGIKFVPAAMSARRPREHSAMADKGSLRSAMLSSASVSATKPASARTSKMSAVDKAKLKSGIRTDGHGGILCCNDVPCWLDFCGPCRLRDPSHRPRGGLPKDAHSEDALAK